MYLDPSLLTAGTLRLLQLLLNPFIMAGLQSAANPNNGLPFTPTAVVSAAPLPPRQLGGSADFLTPFGSLAALGSVQAMGPMAAMTPGSSSVSTAPGSMTMAAMPPMSYAPWLFGQPLPAVPSTPTGPLYVPPSAVPSLTSSPQTQGPQAQGGQASLAAGALSVLEQAIAPYTNGGSSSASSSAAASDDTASPMPMHTLLSALSSLTSGIRVVVVNFMASFAVMGLAQLLRLVANNLPIILNLLGLSRASMARVIVDGVTRAQCLERAACIMGRHANAYPSTPDVLRWLRSPDPTPAMPEHPVWSAFRKAAEGSAVQCEVFSC